MKINWFLITFVVAVIALATAKKRQLRRQITRNERESSDVNLITNIHHPFFVNFHENRRQRLFGHRRRNDNHITRQSTLLGHRRRNDNHITRQSTLLGHRQRNDNHITRQSKLKRQQNSPPKRPTKHDEHTPRKRKLSVKPRDKARAYVSYLKDGVDHLKDATEATKEKSREAMSTMNELRSTMKGIRNILTLLQNMISVRRMMKKKYAKKIGASKKNMGGINGFGAKNSWSNKGLDSKNDRRRIGSNKKNAGSRIRFDEKRRLVSKTSGVLGRYSRGKRLGGLKI